jgi:hypothetical protein
MTDIVTAIRNINPNAEVTCINEDYNQIEWLNDTPVISKSDIETKIAELKTAQEEEVQAKEDLKLSAKTKLMNGEALTEEEANVMVGL